LDFVAVKRELVNEENYYEEKDDFGIGLKADKDKGTDRSVEELFEVLVFVHAADELKKELIECDYKIDRDNNNRSDRAVSFEISIDINISIPIE
jgi:hypothetical protein